MSKCTWWTKSKQRVRNLHKWTDRWLKKRKLRGSPLKPVVFSWKSLFPRSLVNMRLSIKYLPRGQFFFVSKKALQVWLYIGSSKLKTVWKHTHTHFYCVQIQEDTAPCTCFFILTFDKIYLAPSWRKIPSFKCHCFCLPSTVWLEWSIAGLISAFIHDQ